VGGIGLWCMHAHKPLDNRDRVSTAQREGGREREREREGDRPNTTNTHTHTQEEGGGTADSCHSWAFFNGCSAIRWVGCGGSLRYRTYISRYRICSITRASTGTTSRLGGIIKRPLWVSPHHLIQRFCLACTKYCSVSMALELSWLDMTKLPSRALQCHGVCFLPFLAHVRKC